MFALKALIDRHLDELSALVSAERRIEDALKARRRAVRLLTVDVVLQFLGHVTCT
jgi:ferritin-like metal-binding protein YciE